MIGLSFPPGKTAALCDANAHIDDEVEYRELYPSPRFARGCVIRELTLQEFRDMIGDTAWERHNDLYRRIGRYWECSVVEESADVR